MTAARLFQTIYKLLKIYLSIHPPHALVIKIQRVSGKALFWY